MFRGNIVATLLKILRKNLYSVKCYAKSNMNIFTLSLRENFRRGLIYFDQFSLEHLPYFLQFYQLFMKTQNCTLNTIKKTFANSFSLTLCILMGSSTCIIGLDKQNF